MKIRTFRKTFHSINFRKFKDPAIICIGIFILSTLCVASGLATSTGKMTNILTNTNPNGYAKITSSRSIVPISATSNPISTSTPASTQTAVPTPSGPPTPPPAVPQPPPTITLTAPPSATSSPIPISTSTPASTQTAVPTPSGPPTASSTEIITPTSTPISVITPTPTATPTPTLPPTTFGNTAVGILNNYFGTDKDASRFQLTQSGQVQSISTYFTTTGFSAKAAIYTDNNGAPNTLIAQSSSQTVTTTGWNTFTLPQSTLTTGYYWLCIISSSSSATGTMSSTTANTHAWKTTTYSNEYTSTFGTPTGYETTTTSIYATYIPTSTTTPTSTPTPTIAPTPTPTPIQTPSPTPTPTPILAPVENSLISINDGDWYTDSQWLQCPALNVQLDTTDTCGGSPSWEITGNAVNLGVDYGGLGVAPGDKIVFSCWIKTSAATLGADVGNPQAGGEIGIDIYGAKGVVCPIYTPNGVGTPTNTVNDYVQFGTNTWTQVTMSFTVASTFQAQAGYGNAYSGGQSITPIAIIPWLVVWSDTQGSNEHGTAWFADPQVTVTPP